MAYHFVEGMILRIAHMALAKQQHKGNETFELPKDIARNALLHHMSILRTCFAAGGAGTTGDGKKRGHAGFSSTSYRQRA